MTKWETYLGTQLSQDTWSLIWRRAAKSSTCTSYQENQFKILMFWYHTPSLLHSLFPMTPDIFWRCGIQPLWALVRDLIYRVVGVKLLLTPLSLLLNVTSCKLTPKASSLILHMLTVAKCLIAAFWKRRYPPSIDMGLIF